MAGSFERIDYRLRPAKHVERLMLCDAFRRLKFAPIEDYQYVGMGSVYFSDFALLHKDLGIREMYSIEAVNAETVQERFAENRPFSNIKMLWGKCSAVLPGVDLSRPTVLWLDYDGRLDRSVLNDLSDVVGRISEGCVCAISVQCVPDDGESDGGFDFRKEDANPLLTYAAHKLGIDRIDPKWRESDLAGWGTAKLFWEVVRNEVNAVLSGRNGSKTEGKMECEQIVHFHYADGAYMLTVGWVFFHSENRRVFDSCAFNGLGFYRSMGDAFSIKMPLLTLRELRHLERQMPDGITNPDLRSIPDKHARRFISLYRYFPNFSATSL